MKSKISLLLVTCLFAIQNVRAQSGHGAITPFLEKYCTECHDADKEKGDIRLDQFQKNDPELWKLVYEQLLHEEMPPSKKTQPSTKERKNVMNYLLQASSKKEIAATTGMRKLNKREYNNTLRDLLGLRKSSFSPANFIYPDDVEHGFDTEAEKLVLSSELLLEYLLCAELSVKQALFTDDYSRPESQINTTNPQDLRGGNRRFTSHSKNGSQIREGQSKIFSGNPKDVIRTSGYYNITVKAEGIDRNTLGVKLPPFDNDFLLELGLIYDKEHQYSNDGEVKQVFWVKDGFTQTFQMRTWIDSGYLPYVAFQNGHGKPAVVSRGMQRKSKSKLSSGEVNNKLPGIKITGLEVEGPLIEEWPPVSYKTTYGTDTIPDIKDGLVRKELLEKFLYRAFRKPVERNNLNLFEDFLDEQYVQTKNWHTAIVRTFASVLSSQDFLYIKSDQGELNAYELASRLSYFFWSSMPDDELFTLAASGELKDPEVYKAQIVRLFNDPRTEEFCESFPTQWLSLDKLGSMPPETKGPYKQYYQLREDMLGETLQFFNYVFTQNRSVTEFIDSDYTFLNSKLAEFYGIPFRVNTEMLIKYRIPEGSSRGGLISQASILTLTANGVETTPIERGHWLLDEFMGTPPPPPPKEVPALTADLNGLTTIRQQLLKHREDINCRECHLKMDPAGFAMESFDPIGRFREKYRDKQSIETHGVFMGKEFGDIQGLKDVLLGQDYIIARNILIKIAEYAKGRKLNIQDLEVVDKIISKTAKDNYKFRTMIGYMLTSPLMLNY